MKIEIEPDRIRWTAETAEDNVAICALGDVMFSGIDCPSDIINDHGCLDPLNEPRNWQCTPLPENPEWKEWHDQHTASLRKLWRDFQREADSQIHFKDFSKQMYSETTRGAAA